MPREHGSWAVLIAPILVGLAAAGGGPPAPVALFCAAALGGFLLRAPLQSLLSPSPSPGAWAWLAADGVAAAAGALPLIFVYARWGLLGFAVVAAVLMVLNLRANLARRAFSFANEILGIAGLCLGAPAAFYAARGVLAPAAWQAWVLSAAYFVGPVFDVKAAALRHRAFSDASCRSDWERMKFLSLAYHAAALAVVCLAAFFKWAPAAAVLPFLAALHKTWSRGRLAPGRVDFRRLGFAEAGYSVFFALSVGLGFFSR